MSKPRKKWEPKYRFGGNPATTWTPPVLGEGTSPYFVKKPQSKRKK